MFSISGKLRTWTSNWDLILHERKLGRKFDAEFNLRAPFHCAILFNYTTAYWSLAMEFWFYILSVCLSVSLTVCLTDWLSIIYVSSIYHLSVCLTDCLTDCLLSMYHLSVYLSVCLSIYLSSIYFCGTRGWNQAFVYAKQMLYHWPITSGLSAREISVVIDVYLRE